MADHLPVTTKSVYLIKLGWRPADKPAVYVPFPLVGQSRCMGAIIALNQKRRWGTFYTQDSQDFPSRLLTYSRPFSRLIE